jgi:hypothetical protein
MFIGNYLPMLLHQLFAIPTDLKYGSMDCSPTYLSFLSPYLLGVDALQRFVGTEHQLRQNSPLLLSKIKPDRYSN